MIVIDSLKEYQSAVLVTAPKGQSSMDAVENAIFGIVGEAGELFDLLKKIKFQGHKVDVETLKEEAGDVMWYLAYLAHAIGVDFDEVAAMNIAKLRKRYPEGFSVERSVHREV